MVFGGGGGGEEWGRGGEREKDFSRPPNNREKTPLPAGKCNVKFMPTMTFVLVGRVQGRVSPS